MNKRRLLLALAFVIIVVTFVLVVLLQGQSKGPVSPTATPSPTINPDDALIRRLAQEFVPKWGTYSYLDFATYQDRVRPLLTPEFGERSFGQESLSFRQRSLERDKFEITTSLKEISSVAFGENKATVTAKAAEAIKNVDGEHSDGAEYQIIYVKNGSLWKVSDVVINK